MRKKIASLPEARILRHRAEQLLQNKVNTAPSPATAENVQRLYHELQVHQIELEMQNEELHQLKAEADSSLERFTGLFDFAPVGYITLDHKGTIHAVNFAGAALLGDARSQLVGRPFRYFLANDSSCFSRFLNNVFANQDKRSGEFTLQSAGGGPQYVHIEANTLGPGADECLLAVIDVTDLRQKDPQRG